MTKSVLLSIHPQYCELIANGEKTVEVRKTRPKLDTPFVCYIYCTIPKKFYSISEHLGTSNEYLHLCDEKVTMGDGFDLIGRDYKVLNGKVIGEFVCDKIERYPYVVDWENPGETMYLITTAQGERTCLDYAEFALYGKGKILYGWHVSDPVIYDKPRELSEFGLKRPPQSWCYVCDKKGR